MSKYEQTDFIKSYTELPIINEYKKFHTRDYTYDYTSNIDTIVLDKLKDIIRNENIEKINKNIEKIKFEHLTKKQVNSFSINIEKTIKGILILFAKQKIFEEDSVYILDELDPYIIGEFCIQCKLSFNTYLRYSLLIKKCFIEYISKNYIFDEWGFYTTSKDKESIELFFNKEYKEKFISSRKNYVSNSKNIIEETDF